MVFLVSKGPICGWTPLGVPPVLLLQTAWVRGPCGGSGMPPGVLRSQWLPSVTVPWTDAAWGL